MFARMYHESFFFILKRFKDYDFIFHEHTFMIDDKTFNSLFCFKERSVELIIVK